mmetsp:Transcript_63772/g.139760  ORF Transcript_63772/g.139760 Transcript_63772/m.139760 type:complete len:104 (-) Transcript_63772:3-314(-)
MHHQLMDGPKLMAKKVNCLVILERKKSFISRFCILRFGVIHLRFFEALWAKNGPRNGMEMSFAMFCPSDEPKETAEPRRKGFFPKLPAERRPKCGCKEDSSTG